MLLLSFGWASSVFGAVQHIPIASNVALKPGQAYTINLEATAATEIGWEMVQAKPCANKCVQATDISGGINYSIAVPLGASMKYVPASGKITVEYKNVSTEPVAINIYRVHRTCEAEACRFLDHAPKGRWLVFRKTDAVGGEF